MFQPIKGLMLSLISGSCILPQTPVGVARCSKRLMDVSQSSEQPQPQPQNPGSAAVIVSIVSV